MKDFEIGCCAPSREYDALTAAGFDYIELPAWEVEAMSAAQAKALAERLRAAGVPCPRLNAYCKGVPAIVGDAVDDRQTEGYAKSLMEKAAILGVESVGIGAPAARRLPAGYDAALADAQCRRFLEITAKIADRFGISLCLEACHKGFCDYMNETAHALRMARELNLANVVLVVDLFNMQEQGERWYTLEDYMPLCRHIHVSMGHDTDRKLYAEADAPRCDEAFRAIAKAGYRGTVSVEPNASALTGEAMRISCAVMRAAAEKAARETV